MTRQHKNPLFFLLLISFLILGLIIPCLSLVHATTYYQVTALDNSNGYGAISIIYNGAQLPSGIWTFPQNAVIQVYATPTSGYTFQNFVITPANGGTSPPPYAQNPVTINVIASFTITDNFIVLPASQYKFIFMNQKGDGTNDTYSNNNNAFGTYVGGSAIATLEPQDITLGYGVYMLNASQEIVLTENPNANYQFNYWDGNVGSDSFINNILRFYITQNMSIWAYFTTASVIPQTIPNPNSGSTATNWILNSGQYYNLYVSVFTNGSIGINGQYFIQTTPLVTNVNDIANWQQVANGNYATGYINSALQIANSTVPLYQGLQIFVLDKNQNYTLGQETAINVLKMLNIGSSFINLFDSNIPSLKLNTTLVNFVASGVYTIEWLPSNNTNPTPTLTPITLPFGINITYLAIAIYVASIIGLIMAFFYLHNNNIPFAVALGLIIATVLCAILNILGIYTFPIIALIIVAVIAIIVFMRH